MNESISRRLSNIERDFLSAIPAGPAAIEQFEQQWQSLIQDWEEHCDTLDKEVAALGHEIFPRMAALAEDYFESQTKAITIADSLDEDIAAIVKSLDIDPEVPPQTTRSVSRHDCEKLSPATWLLQNLHNPYPPQALKELMERSIDSTAKSISEWFTKARQRIGWTRLMRDRFNGCRSAATQAAFRAYVRDDPTNPLEPELMTAFLVIKSHAELVFTQNPQLDEDRCSERSRSISPTPSLTFSLYSDDSDEDVPLVAGRKRSISHISQEVRSYLDDRPSKRSRSRLLEFPSDPISPNVTASAPHDPQTPLIRDSVVSVGSTSSTSRRRKRRLSDTEIDQHKHKRPHGQDYQRPYAVSDPLPNPSLDNGLEAWFESTFQMPSPANIYPIDTNLQDSEFLRAIDFVNTVEIPNELPTFLYDGYPSKPHFDVSNDPHPITVVDVDEPSSTSPPPISTSTDLSEFTWGDYLNFDFEFWNPPAPGFEHISDDLHYYPFTLQSVPNKQRTLDATLDYNPAMSSLSDSDESESVGKWLVTNLL